MSVRLCVRRASRLTCSLVSSCLNQTTLCSFQPSRRTVRRWTCNQQTPLWRRSFRYVQYVHNVQCAWPQFHLVLCTRSSNRGWCVWLSSTYLHTYVHTYIFTYAHRDLLYTMPERTVIVTSHTWSLWYILHNLCTYVHLYVCAYMHCVILCPHPTLR